MKSYGCNIRMQNYKINSISTNETVGNQIELTTLLEKLTYLQTLSYIPHAGNVFLIGGEVFDDHWHVRVLGVCQLGIEIDIQRTLATGTLLKLECVFRLKQNILQMATDNGAVKLLETLSEKLIIVKISLRCGNHIDYIEMGSEFRAVDILYQM